jgi:phosphocarrier protein HPr
MKEAKVQVTHEVGLHARPASLFVKTASEHAANIQVRNDSNGTDWVDAKSILSILTLAVEQDHEIVIRAEGEDEEEAIEALTKLVQSNFGE